MSDPRAELRNLISAKIHAKDCGCPDFRPDGTDRDDAYYRGLADAVMELFGHVRWENWQIGPTTIPDAGLVAWTKPTAHGTEEAE